LLLRWRAGDESALNELMPLVYNELRSLAGRFTQREHEGHTLQATALVHEAYMRLVAMDVQWEGRAHFLALAARLMRRILVDHAKGKRRVKRGGVDARVDLDIARIAAPMPDASIIDLDEALARLAEKDERKARVVEMHFFGGLNYDQLAEMLGVSPATVSRDLRLAKAWLRKELAQCDDER
jgi:RNA polymerase sigma factor (TIGR02999 family)